MQRDDITREQAAEMSERIRQSLEYLTKLRKRLDARHFPPHDKFRQLVERAHEAVHALSVELHYLRCSGGVWREGKQ